MAPSSLPEHRNEHRSWRHVFFRVLHPLVLYSRSGPLLMKLSALNTTNRFWRDSLGEQAFRGRKCNYILWRRIGGTIVASCDAATVRISEFIVGVFFHTTAYRADADAV